MLCKNPRNQNLTYDQTGLSLTESFEGLRLTAYRDQNGVLTVGYGHATGTIAEGETITLGQAQCFLQGDIQWAESFVKGTVEVALSQDEFDACVDLCFNIGSGNFRKSSVLNFLNQGQYSKAADAFKMWDETAGQINAGLLRRRLSETELFNTGIIQT